MWGQPGLDSNPPSGAWREQKSTTATAPEVGLSRTEGVISDPENGAELGVGQPEIPAQEEIRGQPGLDIRLDPGENSNLRQLHPRKSVSTEQMVLFDIENGRLGFSERYQPCNGLN